MTEYLLNKNHGHLILETGSSSLLVDTGAPSSVGKQRIHLCEREFPVMDNYLGVTWSGSLNKLVAKSMGYWEWTSFPNFLWNWRFQGT